MFKVVLIGPESTGKTVLAQQLASHFSTLWVPEFARSYLDIKRAIYDPYGRKSEEICQPQDIPPIVIGQISQEEAMATQANKLLFCDTNPLQTQVYNKYYFGRKDEWLAEVVKNRKYDLCLLTNIDIPWIADAQRDRPNDRETLFQLFRQELIDNNSRFEILSGDYTDRIKNAVELVKKGIEG